MSGENLASPTAHQFWTRLLNGLIKSATQRNAFVHQAMTLSRWPPFFHDGPQEFSVVSLGALVRRNTGDDVDQHGLHRTPRGGCWYFRPNVLNLPPSAIDHALKDGVVDVLQKGFQRPALGHTARIRRKIVADFQAGATVQL